MMVMSGYILVDGANGGGLRRNAETRVRVTAVDSAASPLIPKEARSWQTMSMLVFVKDFTWMMKECFWMLLIPEICLVMGAVTALTSFIVLIKSASVYRRFPDYQAKMLCALIESVWLVSNVCWMVADCLYDAPVAGMPWQLMPLLRPDASHYDFMKGLAGYGCILGTIIYLLGVLRHALIPRIFGSFGGGDAQCRLNSKYILLQTSTATWCLKDFLWSKNFVVEALIVDCCTALCVIAQCKVQSGRITCLGYAWLAWVASNAIWLLCELGVKSIWLRFLAGAFAALAGAIVASCWFLRGEVDEANALAADLEQVITEVTIPSSADSQKVRVAVIGAGPCGLSALWAFKDTDDVDVVCFEKQGDIGGQWNYCPSTPLEQHANHSSMYKDLWSNGPKEAGSEYPDYTFMEHFGSAMPSFLPRAAIADYIKGRAKKYGLTGKIRLKSEVKHVMWDYIHSRFNVVVNDISSGKIYTDSFAYVIVANGHFSTPEFPIFPGYDTFAGKIIHAKDFHDARRFKDLRVLVVGGSLSAEDIALQCHKFGATEVTITNRSPMSYPWPNNVSEVPMLVQVQGLTAYFSDGTSKDIDVIISCTGYKYDFPFLPSDLQLRTKNVLVVKDLFKGVFFVPRPELMYLGMQNQVYTFIMFDLQACLARDAIIKRFHLPSEREMLNDIGLWLERQEQLKHVKDWHALQTMYVQELNQLTEYCPDEVSCLQLFDDAEDDKAQDLLTFRNLSYTSQFSNAFAPAPRTPWSLCLDELTLDEYLQTERPEPVRAEMRMSSEEYAQLERATIEKWGIHRLHTEVIGYYVAPSMMVPAGNVVMVLPPYCIQTWDEVTDFNSVIQVRFGGVPDALFSCASTPDSLDCYLNHSCKPNLQAMVLADFSVNMVALRDINPFEMLTWDYDTTEEDMLAFGGEFECACGHSNCRKMIRGRNWLDDATATLTMEMSPGKNVVTDASTAPSGPSVTEITSSGRSA
eukprot:TRINITY_DN2444_c0_g1_i3.p1 TRINITY_DN2444_c0_g1~~TRINITY_DN2444_c0_g1_i3.p1  ORF type:complete len:975 (+),score=145.44 TRINITY_DN2444_c0_g1_i3:26-2950(+)